MDRQRPVKKLRQLLIILLWLLIWELAARAADNSIILVGPVDSLGRLISMLPDPQFWSSVGSTLLRIMSGFFMSVILTSVLGALAHFHHWLRELLSPVIALMKAIPVASFVILVLIWLRGSRDLSIVVTFIVVTPMIWDAVLGGLSAADTQLLELAEVYRLSLGRRLRYIYLPALLPYILSSISSVIGMAWKSGVAAELIGQPTGSIGFYLYQSKVFLDTSGLFAWTFMVILLSWLSERLIKALIGLVERRL